MKKLPPILAISALIAGCASQNDLSTVTVSIKSEPEGAIIVVNNFRYGPAPLSVQFESNEDGYFIKKNMITALPQSSELFTQMVSYPAYSPSNPEISKAPKEITFIMTKSPKDEGGVITKN